MKQIAYTKILSSMSVLCGVLLALVAFVLAGASVHAAFPGTDGEITHGSIDINLEAGEATQLLRRVDQSSTPLPSIYESNVIAGFPQGFLTTPRYSADGSKVVFGAITTVDEDSQKSAVFVADADGSNIQTVRSYIYDFNNETSPTSCGPQSYSFHPSGGKLIYNEVCGDGIIKVVSINSDGSEYQVLFTGTNTPHSCQLFPVYSPDGTKIAYNQIDSNGSRIVTVNADGSSPSTLVEVNQEVLYCDRSILSNVIGVAADSFGAPLDWSPDGQSLVYIESRYDDEDAMAYVNIKTVTLGHAVATVAQSAISGIGGTLEGTTFISPQFTPEGKIIYLEREATSELSSFSVVVSSRDGSNARVITSVQSTPDDYLAGFSYIAPTVRPIFAEPESSITNQATFLNSQNNKPVLLLTPEDTQITCSNGIKENTQLLQDDIYDYPLGLVEFCFDTGNLDNQVTLTFVTDLTPSQVTARKYNTSRGAYFDISAATITQTTYQGQPALQLTYAITDNGQLDLDPAVGSIKDPVGLGIIPADLAVTGEDLYQYKMVAGALLVVGSIALPRVYHRVLLARKVALR